MAGDYSFSDVRSMTSPSRWLRLKSEGDECFVAFPVDDEDKDFGAVFYGQHWPEGANKPVTCSGKDCELCKKGDKASWRMAITVLNLETGEKQILDGFPAMWFTDLQDMLAEYDWKETGFKIKRKGQKSQTRRNLMPKLLTESQKVELAMTVPFTADELKPKPFTTEPHPADGGGDPGPIQDDEDLSF